jgi:predicted small secreted protein
MRRTITTISALLIATSLTACGAGQDAATRNIKKVTDGAELSITQNGSAIKIVNLLLVATESGDAVVVGTIINQGVETDQLLGIAVGGNTAILTGDTTLAQSAPLRFEGDSANVKAVFSGVKPVAGRHVKLSLGFARAGLVTAEVIIRDQRDDYKNIVSNLPEATSSPDSQQPE